MNITLHYRYQDGIEQPYRSSQRVVVLGHGSDPSIDLDLRADALVARWHARIYYDLSAWWIEDFGSTTGTFLNNQRVSEPTSLAPGDQLQLGDTIIRTEFVAIHSDITPGIFESHIAGNEIQPSALVSEDQRLAVLVRIARLVGYAQGRQALIEGCLQEIAIAFPQAERRTILLIDERELVPWVYWPPDQSYISFTLAREAIRKRQAFYWVRSILEDGGAPLSESLIDTTSALYAPILCNGQVIGVIHIDTTAMKEVFSEQDLQLLSVVANTVGAAITVREQETVAHIPSVLIVYDRTDRACIDRLASRLRRQKVKVWFDERLQSEEFQREQFAIALRSIDAVIFVMSPSSVASHTVQWEIETALALTKTIIPLMYQHCTVPRGIQSIPYLPFDTDDLTNIGGLVERLYDEKQHSLSESPHSTDSLTIPPNPIQLSLRFVSQGNTTRIIWASDVLGDSRESNFSSPYDARMLPLVIKALDAIQYPDHPDDGPVFSHSEQHWLKQQYFWSQDRIVSDIHEQVGRSLYGALTHDPEGAIALRSTRDYATMHGQPLEYRFAFPSDAAHIAALPWELLWETNGPLLLSQGKLASLVRYLTVGRALPPAIPPRGHLRILAIAPKTDLPESVHVEERAARTAAWFALEQAGLVMHEELSPATPDALINRVQNGPAVDIIHFYGHGRYQNRQGALLFDSLDEGGAWIGAEQLASIFADTQLVMVMACQSSMVSQSVLISGVASALSVAGVPIVIAMQLTIRIAAATRFCEVVYRHLARGVSVQQAVNFARQALFVGEPDRVSWYVPTVTIRAHNSGPLYIGARH